MEDKGGSQIISIYFLIKGPLKDNMRVRMILKDVHVVDEEVSEDGFVLIENQSALSFPEVSVLEGPWGGGLRMWGLVVFIVKW